MLAGCPAFQAYHRQYGQPRVHVTSAASPPASPPPCGLIDHPLFQPPSQHCLLDSQQYERNRNYGSFPDEVSFKLCQGEGITDLGTSGLHRRSSHHDELAKLVNPFLGAEKKDGTPRKTQNYSRSESYAEMAAGNSLQTSKFQVIIEEPDQYPVMELANARAGETWQQKISAGACKLGVVELAEKKEWAVRSWNDEGTEQINSEGPTIRIEEELAPWFLADAAPSDGNLPLAEPSECLYWGEYHLQPSQPETSASSMSTSQYGPGDGASLGGGGGGGAGRDATTASVRGSCSPSSVALSAESPSNSVPSSSTLMLSPPPSSTSAMVQQDSRGFLMTTSNSSPINNSSVQGGTLCRSAREVCYVDRGNMSPLSLPVPKCISLPAGLFSANLGGLPSLVQQQCLMQAEQDREQSTELVDLLVACVEAISAGRLTFINHLLARLGKLASPGGSSMHRLAAYFTEGLACRVSKMWPHIYQPLLPSTVSPDGHEQEVMKSCEGQDAITAWQVLNYATPLVKFSHFTANEMILQAFEGEERVHVIDLDIKQGLQWPALFQCLANRRGGPPRQVRVTGIGECKEEVQDAGDRLAEFAEEVGLKLEFHVVVDKLEDVRLWMLHVKAEPREAVAVNCILQLHHALHDESGAAARNLLSLIHSTRPKVVALVEQEVDCHDHPSLEVRFSSALRYFAALFDALDASLPASSPARLKVESHFAAHIRNILACDGSQRKERYQPLRRWQRLLTPAGFRCIPLSQRTHLQAQILLRMFSSSSPSAASSYGLLPHSPAAEQHHLILAWLDHPLFTASAWTPSS